MIEDILVYIEDNLTEDLNLDIIVKESSLSLFYFHKIFKQIVDEPVMAYIHKRRLIKASYDLKNTDRSIIDIAFEYCYSSQEAFTRSFKKHFNTTPKKYRLSA